MLMTWAYSNTRSLPLAAVGPGHRVISLRLHLDTSRFWLMPLFGAN